MSQVKKELVAVISLISLLLASAGFVMAKKPNKNPEYPFIATFSDNPGDAILSDGGGAYDNSLNSIDFGGWPKLFTGDRTVTLDLSDCLTGNCETPFGSENIASVEVRLQFLATSLDVRLVDMSPGTTQNFVSEIYYKKSRHETWVFYNSAPTPDIPETLVLALDKSGDGISDSWRLSTPQDSIFSVGIEGKGGKFTELDSTFSIPFEVTIDLQ